MFRDMYYNVLPTIRWFEVAYEFFKINELLPMEQICVQAWTFQNGYTNEHIV